MRKAALLNFLYSWACLTLVVVASTCGAMAFLQGNLIRSVALFVAAGVLFHVSPENQRRWWIIGAAIALMIFGLSGVTLPGR